MRNQSPPRKKRTRVQIGAAVCVVVVFAAVLAAEFITERNARYVPDYEKADLTVILEEAGWRADGTAAAATNGGLDGTTGDALTEDAYNALFWQTGLGKDAVDAVLRESGDPLAALGAYQDDFFTAKPYDCRKINPVTGEERLRDEDGKPNRGFGLADVRTGDILIAKSTHTFGWRHGHTGLVVDAARGETLEAPTLGETSKVYGLPHWQTYTTLIHLRARDPEIAEAAVAYAMEHLNGVDYGLLAGLLPPRGGAAPKTTQCAHLPWYAFMQCGIDLNSDGTWLVTPKDIANSEHLEIVQIYGVPPDAPWE